MSRRKTRRLTDSRFVRFRRRALILAGDLVEAALETGMLLEAQLQLIIQMSLVVFNLGHLRFVDREFLCDLIILAFQKELLFVDDAHEEQVLVAQVLDNLAKRPDVHAFHDHLGNISNGVLLMLLGRLLFFTLSLVDSVLLGFVLGLRRSNERVLRLQFLDGILWTLFWDGVPQLND